MPTGLSLKDIPIHDYVGIDDPQIERNADVIKNEVIDVIDSFNVLSKKHLGCKVFVNDAKTFAGLSEPVKDKKDFTMKVTSIASIIKYIPRIYFPKLKQDQKIAVL